MRGPVKELELAIARLEDSSGRRIARRNARRAFLKAINNCKKILNEFPTLNDDGTEIVVNKPKGLRCPSCYAPMRSVKVFCNHWIDRHVKKDIHGFATEPVCPCGKKFGASRQGRLLLCRHLTNMKDILSHFTLGALAKIGGGR